MAIFTIPELLDVIIMCAALGFIFSGYFSKFNVFRKPRDYVAMYGLGRRFNMSDFLFSIYLVGPAIILHELGHKFTALFFGIDATFYSSLSINKLISGIPFFDFPAILMIVALVSSYFGGGFLFFIPGYVAFSSLTTPFQQLLIAFAGPGVNLILWLGSKYLVSHRKMSHKYLTFTMATSKINMILFIFNMIPIPGFDGYKVLSALVKLLY